MTYAQVIVDVRPAHLDRPFDYRVPDGWCVQVGQRVRVVFAGRRRDGWVVGLASRTDAQRVQPLVQRQGELTWFDPQDLRLYRWVAQRWAGTLADVFRHALPKRVGEVEREPEAGAPADGGPGSPPGDPRQMWSAYDADELLGGSPGAYWLRPMVGDEVALAVDLVARTLRAGRSAVVLAPDPASPLLDEALRVAGRGAGADLRAAQSDRSRYRAFLAARAGTARVVVGERGAVLAPAADLGLIVVDDEANPAYKERRSPRHHARDVALARAQMAGVPAVVLSDLPSAALWRLLQDGHVRGVRAERTAERARAPRVDVVDLAGSRTRVAAATAKALSASVAAGRAAVVLAARGGQGAALACQGCGRRLTCPRCAGSLRQRRQAAAVSDGGGEHHERECPACGWLEPSTACPECGAQRTAPLAAGAARLVDELARSHADAEVVRMEGFDAPGPARRPAIGVMTRGSVVTRPAWLRDERAAVLVILDADAMRGRADLEAGEDALRLWMTAARAADRVLVQTREPTDAAVQALVRWDPDGFWEREAQWRAQLGFPPARTLLRVSAPAEGAAEVAAELRAALHAGEEVLGPDPEGGVLVKTAALHGTLQALRPVREAWGRDDRRVRVDVDPITV